MRKFILFQMMQGLVMPSFPAFDYYFAIDVLKVPLDMINMQFLYLGWVSFFIPYIYNKYLQKTNYVWMIVISHIIYIMGDSIGVTLALGLNTHYGIPTRAVYLLAQIVNIIDSGFN